MNVLATAGAASILTALAAALFATIAATAGLRARRPDLVRAARRAIVVVAVFVSVAFAVLAVALQRDDFSLAYVAQVSSRDMQPHMKWAALYSSQQGSLLFWTWVMSVLMAALVTVTVPRIAWGEAHVVASCGAVLVAFLVALALVASPFELSPFTLPDGRGLNPLLVDRGMLMHPPMLLGGLAATSIPFVLGAGALMSGRIDSAWIRAARSWGLLAWLVLSAGNILGAWWAYTVLGFGGYWGWDPVENSAILPLLPLTAFLHSIMVQERRGMLKTWNLALVFAAFGLAVFGTFNVRSGLVASVHSFAQSPTGPYFLALLGITLAVSVALLAWRAPVLRAEQDFASLLSRESSLVVNNYILIAIALVVLGGTLFPVFSELVRGTRITVGPPFYQQVAGPLLLAMLALLVIGTLLPWRGTSTTTFARRLRGPAGVTLLATAALFALGVRDVNAIVGIALSIAVAAVSLREYALGARGLRAATGARGALAWAAAVPRLFDRDRRRYGGYLVHIGLAVMAIAAVVSHVYQQQGRATLAPGQSAEVGGLTFAYAGLQQRSGQVNGIGYEIVAPLEVSRDGQRVATVAPGQRFFTKFPDQPTGIVGLHSSLGRDLYTFVEGWDQQQVLRLQVFVNPLVTWLWIGSIVYVIGGAIAFAPRRVPLAARPPVPAGETSRA